MSDAKLIAALQRNLADAEVERLRLVEELAASHLAAQRMAVEAAAEEREACECADQFNGNTADDLRAAIRARGAK